MTPHTPHGRHLPVSPLRFASPPSGCRVVRVHLTEHGRVWLDTVPHSWAELPDGYAVSYVGANRPNAHLDVVKIAPDLYVTTEGQYIPGACDDIAVAQHMGVKEWAVPGHPFTPPVVAVSA